MSMLLFSKRSRTRPDRGQTGSGVRWRDSTALSPCYHFHRSSHHPESAEQTLDCRKSGAGILQEIRLLEEKDHVPCVENNPSAF